MADSVAVHHWPGAVQSARAQLQSEGLTVVGVPTGSTVPRAQARVQIREAAQALMGGSPSWALLSISHEDTLSVAAVGTPRALGIDIVDMAHIPDSAAERILLAQDYLGAANAALLRGADNPEHAKLAFARAWARWEASLKCHRIDLPEWSPALQKKVDLCAIRALALPFPLVGCVAYLPNKETL